MAKCLNTVHTNVCYFVYALFERLLAQFLRFTVPGLILHTRSKVIHCILFFQQVFSRSQVPGHQAIPTLLVLCQHLVSIKMPVKAESLIGLLGKQLQQSLTVRISMTTKVGRRISPFFNFYHHRFSLACFPRARSARLPRKQKRWVRD